MEEEYLFTIFVTVVGGISVLCLTLITLLVDSPPIHVVALLEWAICMALIILKTQQMEAFRNPIQRTRIQR